MLKFLFLANTLGIACRVAATSEYPHDPNHYPGQPYYQGGPLDLPPPIQYPYHYGQQQPAPPDILGREPVESETQSQMERFGGFLAPPPFAGGNFGVGFGGPPMMGPPPQMGTDGMGPPPNGFKAGPPPNGPIGPPPFGFPDPGFQTQTGFEGMLVPNSWYGLLPWGIEGVIIVIAGMIVFAIVVMAIIGLLGWFCGVKTVLPILKTEDDTAEARSRFGDQWAESFADLSANVIDAIDKFNDVLSDESEDEDDMKKRKRHHIKR